MKNRSGYRLLTQVMPSKYRQGLTYPVKSSYTKETHSNHKMKIYGGKILRRWLKEKLQKELEL